MAHLIDDSGNRFSISRGTDGKLVRTTTLPDGRTVTRPEVSKDAVRSGLYDATAKATKAAKAVRTCKHCGFETADDGEACYECGHPAPEDDDSEAVEKRSQSEQLRFLIGMARNPNDSEIARRGMAALIRQVGPVAAADLVNRGTTYRS